ncbi:MAG TPA: hypothetical protein VHV75_03055 [Solirubrobacteraceae bacterium]|jgi:hypothetical protein|nr:hypothetical protein [Solirubrobacteraceae bacterium]
MSVLDLSNFLTLPAPELLAPPEPPATPAIDTSDTSAGDSTSSGSASDSNSSGSASLGTPTALTAQQQVEAGLLGGKPDSAQNRYDTPEEEAAAALIDLSGASTVTVDDFESSVPPNLAAASALLDALTAGGSVSAAAIGSLYTLMDSSAALALTSS